MKSERPLERPLNTAIHGELPARNEGSHLQAYSSGRPEALPPFDNYFRYPPEAVAPPLCVPLAAARQRCASCAPPPPPEAAGAEAAGGRLAAAGRGRGAGLRRGREGRAEVTRPPRPAAAVVCCRARAPGGREQPRAALPPPPPARSQPAPRRREERSAGAAPIPLRRPSETALERPAGQSRERAASIAGCVYRVVQTTGPDGKNLLNLLPISKSPGNFVPVAQPPAMANRSKPNVPSPLHLPFNAQLANPTAPSSGRIPVCQSPSPGKVALPRTLDKEEGVRAGSERESSVPNAAAGAPSGCVSEEAVSVTSSSEQTNTAYMFVNSQNLPVTVKSPVLPSGHHLQIPADAEVKSVPASSLPPSIQQKILASVTGSAPGGGDRGKPPTVIYVSPVNTVKTMGPKCVHSISPQHTPQVSQRLLMTTKQKEKSCCPEAVPSDGQQCQQAPMKWIVQENPHVAPPCLIPVKSSNNVASKILKTLLGMQNLEVNAANILPLCSSGSQTKITTFKENALVMCNGKVYLLTKRGSDVLSAQAEKQAAPSADASLRKEAQKVIDSTEVNKITEEVVSLLLSKGKLLPQKDPNSKASSPIDLTEDLNSPPAVVVVPSANQQNSTANQRSSLPATENVSSGVPSVPAVGTQENICQNGKERSPSPKAASAVLPQSGAFSEDCQKIQCEKMNSPRKVTQSKHQEKPHWKQYWELRKKFGLFKEERVYLRRIPLPPPCNKQEEDCSSNSSEMRTDSCSSSAVDVENLTQQQECAKEEKIDVELEEDLSRKRKIKSSPVSEGGKRRRSSGKTSTSPNSSSETTNSVSSVLNLSVPPPPALPQQSLSTAPVVPSPGGRDSEQDPDAQHGDSTNSHSLVVVSSESSSSVLEGSFQDDDFPWTPPDLDETIRDEKIKRLKQLLREREAALEEMRRKMQQS
ncbi:ligand-dependent nuclear receptor-interacting factor 1 [Dryobates pubescens]|uniref:ligand-dependent nuclear receptor-interacting factor 1 n=1 Tax=Dryobates pubescens TaxID=118200 RepID=UPI0023B8C864|nr:ligand-dependent nuclear receptor-interacting factor 1 [Dryobates pubescens]